MIEMSWDMTTWQKSKHMDRRKNMDMNGKKQIQLQAMQKLAEKCGIIERQTHYQVMFKLSMRLRSCSKANVLGGVEVFIGGGGPAAVGGAEDECFFAATEAGTKDIIDVAGFLVEVGAPTVRA
jgi:hypothetical protein